jgi:hypothetical protein
MALKLKTVIPAIKISNHKAPGMIARNRIESGFEPFERRNYA